MTQLDRAEALAAEWTFLGHRTRMEFRMRWPGVGDQLDRLLAALMNGHHPASSPAATLLTNKLIIDWTTSADLRGHVAENWPTLSAALDKLATAT